MADEPPSAELVRRLRSEIERLTGLQNEERRRAAFIAMTDDELREYDQRGDRIAELLKELSTITSGRAA
jgi:hypothetical protein